MQQINKKAQKSTVIDKKEITDNNIFSLILWLCLQKCLIITGFNFTQDLC